MARLVASSQQTSKPAKRRPRDAVAFVGSRTDDGMDGDEIKKETYYLTIAQHRALKALAASRGQKLSELMRGIVDAYLSG